MSDDLDSTSPSAPGSILTARPVRVVWLGLIVLGAFEIGRLISGVLIGPGSSQVLLGMETPVMVGDADLSRVAVEVVAIAIGVCLAALLAIPVAKAVCKS